MSDPRDIDVLILGAGINGAGLFRDLCEQGITCAIIDKGDFGSGTSAAPSRLIHGGIKYLETGELRLVAQSTLERNLLLRNAPHYVKPLPTVIPIFSWLRGIPAAIRTLFGSTTAPRARGAVLIQIGLLLYDLYGRRARIMPRHRLWSRQRALAEIPPLTPRIVAAGTYHDAFVTHPERLVLELVQDGLAAHPASVAMNYATLAGTDGDRIDVTGPDGRALSFRPRIVINAAGPWIDAVNRQLGLETRLIGGTKGSHILLDHPALIRALDGRMIYFEADDGRICLVYDYLGRALVGSTDIRASDPDDLRCEDDEIDYFLESLRNLLPGLDFDRRQIVSVYSGIRPLPRSDGTAAGLISRDHSAPVAEPAGARRWPVISLVGGKWTTFRGFAEEVADAVLDRLGRKRIVSTRALPIGGGRNFPADPTAWAAARAGSIPAARWLALLDRYGTRAEAVALAEAKHGGPAEGDAWSPGEIVWIARHDRVVHLADIVLRRTPLALTGSLSLADLRRIAEIAGTELGWGPDHVTTEIESTRALLAARYRVVLY
ncbi:Glycerol-3-phosphate dehydrogenase [Rubellimicrobium thermophilum DSM 16684]|uniref:Glycerol-3-phosphate dehydrogenase n=1 Tax=Rubellimicrobium thermophilum DSM 16684 TaxID=1123069 RepID=S9R720_9RHOB|nr:glycerol-3-phosphate dehydrogenase/oxidase [Rubellimicrobium thermophilum]EPX87788.1 Glycerol-3-phosphate dehydrogenase [Rubellimicrobium thermophilum DSM 16684]